MDAFDGAPGCPPILDSLLLSFLFLLLLSLLLALEGGELEEFLVKICWRLPAFLFVKEFLELLFVFLHFFDGPMKVRRGLAQRALIKECVIWVLRHQIREFPFDLTQV